MKGHQNKAERKASGMQYVSRPPKKKFLKNHSNVKYNSTTRKYE